MSTVARRLRIPSEGQRRCRETNSSPKSRRSTYPNRPIGRSVPLARRSGVAKPPTRPITATTCDAVFMASRQQAIVTSTMSPKATTMGMRPYNTWAAQNAAYRMTTPAPAIPSAVDR
jgi:hypothetical protein